MREVLLVAGSNILRFMRNRSLLVLAIVAPLGIIAALSSTIGPALSGEFRPSLVIADEVGGGALDEMIDGLRAAGFDDLTVVETAGEARSAVIDGEAGAAIVFGADTMGSLADPTAQPSPLLVIGDADSDIATAVAESIATQAGRTVDSIRYLSVLGAPTDDLSGPLTIEDEESGSRVLTDGTYFAVGMTSYFAFFAATSLVATVHRERRESTLARMLVAPVSRWAPLLGKGLAAGAVALLSWTVLVVSSTLFLGADWGPPAGSMLIGAALCVAAVGIAMAIASVTSTEETAGEIGAIVATAWAMFGGVFLPISSGGLLGTITLLSPFRWVMNGIGLNAGVGSTGEVVTHAAAIVVFGLIGVVVAFLGRERLGGA